MLIASHPEVRAAAVFALSSCIQVFQYTCPVYQIILPLQLLLLAAPFMKVLQGSIACSLQCYAGSENFGISLQVGEPEIVWANGGQNTAPGTEQRERVEREREIACYLIMVGPSINC